MGHRGHQNRTGANRPEESELNVKRIIALISIAGALVLTGCSSISSAATVGSEKISQATVQTSIDTVLAERATVDTSQMTNLETGAALNRSQLRFHLIVALLGAVGKDAKVTVTKAEIDTRRASIISQIGGAAALPKALDGAGIASVDLDAYLELILTSEKISAAAVAAGVDQSTVGDEIQKLVVAKAQELKVTVNPRYGTWDSVNGDVIAVDSASPAASTAATP